MTDAVSHNLISNSPYEGPSRRFRFLDEGITDEIVEGHRRSDYSALVPAARTRQPQLQMEAQWTEDRSAPIDEIRRFITRWRATNRDGVTSTTRELLEVRDVDVCDPTTGEASLDSIDDKACWFIDADIDRESFFVRDRFQSPSTGRIAVKVISHYGDQVLEVYDV